MNSRKKRSIIVGVLCVFALAFLGGGGYMLLKNDNQESDKKNVVNIDLSNASIRSLYEKIQFVSLTCNQGTYFDYYHQKEELLATDMRNDLKLILPIYQNRDRLEQFPETEESLKYIPREEYVAWYRSLWGKKATVHFQATSIDLWPAIIRTDENNLYIKTSHGGTCPPTSVLSELFKIEQTKDKKEIYFYEGVVYVDYLNQNDSEEGEMNIYKDSKKTELLAKNVYSYSIKTNKEKVQQFRYTFKLDEDQNYYFYGVEKVGKSK